MLEHELQIKAILEKLNHVKLDGRQKWHNAQEMAESCNNNDWSRKEDNGISHNKSQREGKEKI